jgi:hypothetical protein
MRLLADGMSSKEAATRLQKLCAEGQWAVELSFDPLAVGPLRRYHLGVFPIRRGVPPTSEQQNT